MRDPLSKIADAIFFEPALAPACRSGRVFALLRKQTQRSGLRFPTKHAQACFSFHIHSLSEFCAECGNRGQVTKFFLAHAEKSKCFLSCALDFLMHRISKSTPGRLFSASLSSAFIQAPPFDSRIPLQKSNRRKLTLPAHLFCAECGNRTRV